MKSSTPWDGEVVQWLIALVAFPEDPGLILTTMLTTSHLLLASSWVVYLCTVKIPIHIGRKGKQTNPSTLKLSSHNTHDLWVILLKTGLPLASWCISFLYTLTFNEVTYTYLWENGDEFWRQFSLQEQIPSDVWWHTPGLSALRRLKQISLGDIERSIHGNCEEGQTPTPAEPQ